MRDILAIAPFYVGTGHVDKACIWTHVKTGQSRLFFLAHSLLNPPHHCLFLCKPSFPLPLHISEEPNRGLLCKAEMGYAPSPALFCNPRFGFYGIERSLLGIVAAIVTSPIFDRVLTHHRCAHSVSI